jgi:nucleotide-binding universal stress UspA family protein
MKFDHILFPVDFSEPGKGKGLEKQVEWLAERFHSRVTLLHVVEIPASWYGTCESACFDAEWLESLKAEAKQRLKDYLVKLPEDRVERLVVEGDAAWNITEWPREIAVDLVVMATHGYSKMRGLLLGSVTAKVLHDVSCPVWTDALANLREGSQGTGVSNIVCALELTDEAIPLLCFARELAKDFGAKVSLVHSVPEMEPRPDKYFDSELHRYLTESARVEISKLQCQAGTDFPLIIRNKRVADCVAEEARAQGADLIVVGRGRCQEPLGRLRSHTCDIIRQSPCPVLSYAVDQPVRISSSSSEARLGEYVTGGQVPTGCPTS